MEVLGDLVKRVFIRMVEVRACFGWTQKRTGREKLGGSVYHR